MMNGNAHYFNGTIRTILNDVHLYVAHTSFFSYKNDVTYLGTFYELRRTIHSTDYEGASVPKFLTSTHFAAISIGSCNSLPIRTERFDFFQIFLLYVL